MPLDLRLDPKAPAIVPPGVKVTVCPRVFHGARAYACRRGRNCQTLDLTGATAETAMEARPAGLDI